MAFSQFPLPEWKNKNNRLIVVHCRLAPFPLQNGKKLKQQVDCSTVG